jgi:DNA-binding transcriptional MocR family regulator
MGLCLERLFAGLTVIGVAREDAMRIIEDIALASTPPIRRHAFETLTETPTETREIAKRLKLPTTTTRRALEELAAHGLAERSRGETEEGAEKKGGADLWALDPEWTDWPAKWAATIDGKNDTTRSRDISQG